jgi:thiamine-monophosphate kinase
MKHESQLVERIARALQSKFLAHSKSVLRDSVRLGIGDDAAVLRPSSKFDWIVSCDAFIEEIHFRRNTHPPDSVGYKSLMRAASDLAAMGAAPLYFLLTLAIPAARTGRWLDEFLAGMASASRQLGIRAVGGDTTRSSSISISITVIGEIAPGLALTRSGARPGDLIYVSGTLGRAQLGLALTLAGHARKRSLRQFTAPHLYPAARVALGAWLAQHKIPTATMDLSDGLSTDLARLCKSSRVGAKLYTEKLPRVTIPPVVAKFLRSKEFDPLQATLHGGDDYQLLFTVPPRKLAQLHAAPNFAQLRHVGQITSTRKLLSVNSAGTTHTLVPRGWDSFR